MPTETIRRNDRPTSGVLKRNASVFRPALGATIGLLMFVLLQGESSTTVWGQQGGFDFQRWGNMDSNEFMDQLFGPPSEDEQRMLDKVIISTSDERRFGQQLVDQYVGTQKQMGVTLVERGDDVEYLQELIARLRPQMQNARRYRRIRVLVADTREPDAYSFPGGTLVFTRGLLEFCESEAALLGVVGHELSHLDRGHQLIPLKRTKIAETMFGNQSGLSLNRMMQQMQVVTRGWTRPFRPEDELEADRDATRWLLAIDYDPQEFIHLMVNWQREHLGKDANVPVFLRSHPYTEDRVESVAEVRSKYIKEHPDKVLKIGRDEHRRRVTDK